MISDWFTKFTFIHPLRSALTSPIIKFLEQNVFLVHGVPQYVSCDNSVQFTSQAFKSFLYRYKISKISYNAKYHPQPNFVERTNRIVGTAIGSYIAQDHRKWDENIHQIAHAICAARHEVTGYSPNFLAFGRFIPSSEDFYRNPSLGSDELLEVDNYARTLSKVPSLYKDVQKRIQRAYARNASHYNLRKRDVTYGKGDLLWKRNYVLSNAANYYSEKLAPKFIPCEVHRVFPRLVYNVHDLEYKDLGNWHVKDIKPDPGSQEDSPNATD